MSKRLAPAGCQDAPENVTRFALPFGRQQIADILGLTIETVSRQLTRFKAEGIIDLPSRRDVIILDTDALAGQC